LIVILSEAKDLLFVIKLSSWAKRRTCFSPRT